MLISTVQQSDIVILFLKNSSLENNFYLFLFFGYAEALLLHGLFSSCREWGLVSRCRVQASHRGGISCFGTRAPGHVGFSSFSVWAPKLWLPGSGAQAQ